MEGPETAEETHEPPTDYGDFEKEVNALPWDNEDDSEQQEGAKVESINADELTEALTMRWHAENDLQSNATANAAGLVQHRELFDPRKYELHVYGTAPWCGYSWTSTCPKAGEVPVKLCSGGSWTFKSK